MMQMVNLHLPSINVNSNGATAGDTDFNYLNSYIGATFHFYVETAATGMDIKSFDALLTNLKAVS